jgi:hypothetical protein
MNNVVTSPESHQVPENSDTERDGWSDLSPPTPRIEVSLRGNCDHPYPRDVRLSVARPLLPRDVCDFYTLAREPFAEVTEPTLEAPNRPGE